MEHIVSLKCTSIPYNAVGGVEIRFQFFCKSLDCQETRRVYRYQLGMDTRKERRCRSVLGPAINNEAEGPLRVSVRPSARY